MPRIKKRWKYEELQEHVDVWATERLDELRDMAQETYMNHKYLEQEKEFILQSIADQTFQLINLMAPLMCEETSLVKWSKDFVDEYGLLDKDRDD